MANKRQTNYRKLNEELNFILDELQGGIDIEAAVSKYERGMEIVKVLKDYLIETQNKVTKIETDI